MSSESWLQKFLDRAGSVELLIRLGDSDGLIINELKEQMDVSSDTVNKRTQEARERDLIEINRDPQDHGNAKRYVLTPRGQVVYDKIAKFDLDSALEEIKRFEALYEARLTELGVWIDDHTYLTHDKYPPDEEPENAYNDVEMDPRD